MKKLIWFGLLPLTVFATERAPLPDQIDFRKSPAFVKMSLSARGEARIEQRINAECTEKKEHDRLEQEWSKLFEERNAVERSVHETMKGMPPGDAYSKLFREKVGRIPEYATLQGKIKAAENAKEIVFQKVKPCREGIEKSVFEDIEVFKDAELKVPAGKLRFYFDHWDHQVAGETGWKPYDAAHPPAGEWGYFYQTILTKRGKAVELPSRPFPTKIWFDFEKAFGEKLAVVQSRTGRLQYVFPESDSEGEHSFYILNEATDPQYVPFKIEGETAVFKFIHDPRRSSDRTPADAAARVFKKGKQHRVPLKSLFDKNGHLKLIELGC